MILVDSSVWIDHLRSKDSLLVGLLNDAQILAHPFVIGELALGSLARRDLVLGALRDLPQAASAKDEEVFAFIEQHSLFGLGIGYVDAHLLAATLLSGAQLWTRDRRLREVAQRLRIAAEQT
ncbi:MAG: type II toxin-antitoxin system VapC family toxin [Sphingomonas sp.]